jgi:hypothetical protein
MMSVGFWYVHEANGGATETVVVILRMPPNEKLRLYRQIEVVADKLAAELDRRSRLPCLYVFDGRELREVPH